MRESPLVTVVTPCLNMARFLPEAIESVLRQDYPNIEYLVMDGGSRDETLSVLERYRGRLRYVSAPDGGAANAINRGFAAARGSVIAWLNADDTYLPGAITTAVRHLEEHPDACAVYGKASWVDLQGNLVGPYPTVPFDAKLLARECFICQPATFMRKDAVAEAGFLDESLQLTFDYDLWIRMARARPFFFIPEPLATSRMHPGNKTLGRRRDVFLENMRILKRHYGYVPFQWVFAYCCHLIDGRDQFYDPVQPSFSKYALSLPVGLWQNRTCPFRYLIEWGSTASPQPFLRHLRSKLPRPRPS